MPYIVIRLSDTDAAAVVGEAQTKPDAVDLISADMAKLPGRLTAQYTVAGGDLTNYTAKRTAGVDVEVNP